jgi:hypothetical protein
MAPQQQAMQANGRQQQRSGAGHPGSSQAYPGVSTQGLEDIGYGEQAAQIQTETQQQDRYLDEISKGLDQLKFGAQVSFEAAGLLAGRQGQGFGGRAHCTPLLGRQNWSGNVVRLWQESMSAVAVIEHDWRPAPW